MKNLLKYLSFIFLSLFFFSNVFAQTGEYLYYYGKTCSSCIQLDEFFKKNNIYNKYDITKKEVFYNDVNRQELLKKGKSLGYNLKDIKVPFFIDVNHNIAYNNLNDIVNHFYKGTNTKQFDKNTDSFCDIDGKTCTIDKNSGNKIKNSNFLLVLIPAALADSINPCAFAVLLLILGAILSRFKNRKKVIYSGLAFSLSIFIAYFLLGIGVYKVLGLTVFTQHVVTFKTVIGIIGILIGLFNIKDYFFYGKWFVMEVPFSWRANMKKIIKKTTSPVGAFIVGLIVSLFLLPCTSGPYLTVLGYLSAGNTMKVFTGYLYLILYNAIFILPMLLFTFIIGLGLRDIDELNKIRESHIKKIHLVVGIIMLLIGIYILYEALFFV